MEINIKQVLLIVLGLLIITVIFVFSKLDTVPDTKKITKNFSNWVILCTPKYINTPIGG